MHPKHKKSSNTPYIVALLLLGLANGVLILYARHQHDGMNLVLYSLVPDMFSVYLGLHGFHQNQFNDRHVEYHLRAIHDDTAATRQYVESIVGVPERFDQ